MAFELWSQDVFSKGELSPYMYARATVHEYSNGLKTAQNVLTYPTGAAGKRFGTLFQAILQGFTEYNQFYFQTFQYLNECVYQLVFAPTKIYIYLEGILVAVVDTILNAPQVYNISSTVIGPIFRVTGIGFTPFDLTRINNDPLTTFAIASITNNGFDLTGSALTVGKVYPVTFTTTGTLPSTDPAIIVDVTYFAYVESATNITIYGSAKDAKFRTNAYILNDIGVTSSVIIENTWDFSATTFKNLPVYDFNGAITSYDDLTFTPSGASGIITVTVSGAGYPPLIVPTALTSQYIGGAFIGGGGTGRITAVASATSFTVSVQDPFVAGVAIQGSLVFLGEPAWSTKRGWPQVCSSYQNRALFANTKSLPNGFWASVINDYRDFGDLTADDDDAIAWFPTSNNMNYIRFIVPYRSITVHTNTGIYSSPLSDVVAITPSNFTLQLQDSTPADVLEPQAIDNQILVLSGDDAHQMLWDGINNAYTSDIVSVISEQTIRDPVDEAPFIDLRRAGSRYVFIINRSGTMAIFQTLLSQGVAGFTPAMMEQSYGTALFRQCASSSDGRAWFVVERQIAIAQTSIAITGFTPYDPGPPIVLSTLTAVASNFSTLMPTAVTFTTTGVLPGPVGALSLLTNYWVIGVTADTFNVYLTQEDARAGVNSINFTSAGTNSKVVPFPYQTLFTLEELTQETYLDCAIYYKGGATDTINTGILFNAQTIKMAANPDPNAVDFFGFDAIGVNNEVAFEAHGLPVDVSIAYMGFPINTIMEPMPLSLANGPSAKNTTLTRPKHIRTVNFMFNDTIGGTINGVPIALDNFNMADIGFPPSPARGYVELSVMKGWDDFNNPSYTIFHNEPFNIELLGVFYALEI